MPDLNVHGLPEHTTEEELCQFFNAAWFASVGKDVLELEPELEHSQPCVSCTRKPFLATLHLRTDAVAKVLLERLEGIRYKGKELKILKPAHQGRVANEALTEGDQKLHSLIGSSNGEVVAFDCEVVWKGNQSKPATSKNPVSHYQVLDVSRDGRREEVVSSFRKAFQRCSNQNIGAVVSAYQVLSNPIKRRAYDHCALQFFLDAKKARDCSDARPAVFVSRHAKRIKSGQIRRVQMEDRHAPHFIGKAPQILQRINRSSQSGQMLQRSLDGNRSGYADLIVLAPMIKEVWVIGDATQMDDIKRSLKHEAEEADGKRAPPDGVVITIPKAHAEKIPEGDKRRELVDAIKAATYSTVTFCEDRIILRSGQVPFAVAMLQKKVLWRGEVTCFDGSKMDAWAYTLVAERQSGGPNERLVPDREPDTDEVEAILKRESPQGDSRLERGQRILQLLLDGKTVMSFTLIKLLTSRVLHFDVSQAKLQVQCEYVVSIVRTWSQFRLTRPLGDFQRNSLLLVLWRVPQIIVDNGPGYRRQMVHFIAQKIPTGPWVEWNCILKDIRPYVAKFLELACHQLAAAETPVHCDQSWSTDTFVCSFILQHVAGEAFHVHERAGMCRRVDYWNTAAGLPIPQVVPAQPAAVPKVIPPKAAPPSKESKQAPEPELVPAPAPPAPAKERSRSRSPSQSRSPRRSPSAKRITPKAERKPMSVPHWQESVDSALRAIARAERVSVKDCKQMLFFAGDKKNHFGKKTQIPRILDIISSAASGSLQELQRLVDRDEEIPLMQAICDLDQVEALDWKTESLLLLLHSATTGVMEEDKNLKDKRRMLLKFIERPPFNDLIGREECYVIPYLMRLQSISAQRKVCEIAGKFPIARSIQDSLLEGLEATAKAAKLSTLSQLAACFKSAGFSKAAMIDTLSMAADQVAARKGFESMTSVWHEVTKCVELGVPEAMDPFLQKMRAFGSLERFSNDEAPPSVTVFLSGAAVRLDAAEIFETASFSEKSMAKLNLEQLTICLQQLPKVRAKERALTAAMKYIATTKTDVKPEHAIVLVQAADELEIMTQLDRATIETVFVSAIYGNTLADCMMVLNLLVKNSMILEVVEAVAAIMILEFVRTTANLADSLLELRNAVQILYKLGALGRLPGFIRSMSYMEKLHEVAQSPRCNDSALATLLSILLPVPGPKTSDGTNSCFQRDLKDVQKLVDHVITRKTRRWEIAKLERELHDEKLKNRLQKVLGNLWLPAILLNYDLQWSGREIVVPEHDQLARPAFKLAEKLCGIEPDQVKHLPSESESHVFKLLIRVVGYHMAGGCLPGLYTVIGHHHGCPVYRRTMPAMDQNPVLIYYWSEEKRWYIGPEVGGALVWAYASNAKTANANQPPRRNWYWQGATSASQNFQIKVFALEAPSSTEVQAEPPARAAAPKEAFACKKPKVEVSCESREPEAPPQKRPRHERHEAVPMSKEDQCRTWLQNFDERGSFLQYFPALEEQFDADLENVKEARLMSHPSRGRAESIDEEFWKAINVKSTGHKIMFAKKIWQLP
ncbi:Uncharacterized protein SCF082_LOCUS948 [Durusdinium trenchii]|uniref:Uncharacterized protein n=1 Tax=Durusdinium trenchii TaxID=1381693 RepID=A0ABP0HAZ4_9DINO